MPKAGKILILAGGLLSLLAACVSPPHLVVTLTTGLPTGTPLPPVTVTIPATETETPTPVPLAGLTEIHMFTELAGWALAVKAEGNSQLLHTLDGGQTWSDVTPPDLPADILSTSYLDEKSAWVFDYNSPSNGLARTQDGGKTWTMLPGLPIPQDFSGTQITFLDEMNGWFRTADPGAGSADIGIFATRDGGLSWNQILLTAPPDQPDMSLGLLPGSLHLCMMCRDAFYYDPIRVMILYGDLNAPGNPAGSLRLSISMDAGKTWKNQQFVPPSGNVADENVSPMLPVFFNQMDGLLAFGFVKFNQDMSTADTRLLVYDTHDGGLSWNSVANSLLGNVNVLKAQDVVDFVSPQDAFVPCGNFLCATHDGARTWQTLKSNLNMAYADGIEYVELIDFINATTGWAITSGSNSRLWKTMDGGVTWQILSASILPH